ncbi:MAG: hypothetical protein JXR73_22945 [Candidatus Omnitrophica bacterium]|nr:hypothetical protein [Candidatus Omnitrophota bacterium]
MNRLFIFLIVLLIGFNFVLNGFNDDFKVFLQNKFSCAVDYYADKARYYYGRLTGQIPSELVVKNPREWARFEIVCDALLLDPFLSEELFALYIQSRNEALEEIKSEQGEKREAWRPGQGASGQKPPLMPPRRLLIHPWEETAVARLGEKIEGQLSPDEWELASDVLKRFWGLSPIVELRALRKIQVNELQRTRLLPYAIALVEAQRNDDYAYDFDALDVNNQQDFQLAQAEFLEKAQQILTNEQQEKWSAMKTQVQDSIKNDPRRIEWDRRNRPPRGPRSHWSMASLGS